jgi:hypothetical protein
MKDLDKALRGLNSLTKTEICYYSAIIAAIGLLPITADFIGL